MISMLYLMLLVVGIQCATESKYPIGDGYSKLSHCMYVVDHKHVFTLHNITNFYYSINFTRPDKEVTNETFHFNPCEVAFVRRNSKTYRTEGYFCKSNDTESRDCSDYYSYHLEYLEKVSNISQVNKRTDLENNPYYEIRFQLPRGNISFLENVTDPNNVTNITTIKHMYPFNVTMNISCNIRDSIVHEFFGQNNTINDSSNKFVFNKEDILALLNYQDNKTINYTVHMATALKCFYENYYIGNEFFYIYTPTCIISAILFILMAVYYLIFSLKFINITYILSSGLAFAYLSYSFVFNYSISFRHQSLSEKKYVLIFVLAGFIIGILLGFVFTKKKLQKVNTFIMNAGTGLMFALLLYHSYLKYLIEHVDTTYWITIILFVFSFGLLSNYYEAKLFFELVSSAFIGGYLLVRGISMFIGPEGGFHNDAIIYDLSFWLEKAQFEQYTPLYAYIYIGGWVIAMIVSIVIQRNNMNAIVDDDE